MKRRLFVKALAGVPAASSLLAQQPGANQSAPGVPLNPVVGVQPPAAAADELPKLQPSVAEVAADAMPRFFTAPQFAALRRVSDLLMPAGTASAGAVASGAPEFLDFLIGDSPAPRQRVYREGLDGLNAQSRSRFGKLFAELDNTQADSMLAPLSQPWKFEAPADPVSRFLVTAKADVRLATVNARPPAATAGTGRRFNGSGQYWYPLD